MTVEAMIAMKVAGYLDLPINCPKAHNWLIDWLILPNLTINWLIVPKPQNWLIDCPKAHNWLIDWLCGPHRCSAFSHPWELLSSVGRTLCSATGGAEKFLLSSPFLHPWPLISLHWAGLSPDQIIIIILPISISSSWSWAFFFLGRAAVRYRKGGQQNIHLGKLLHQAQNPTSLCWSTLMHNMQWQWGTCW